MELPAQTFWDMWGEAVIAVMVAGLLILAIKHVSAFYNARIAARAAGGAGIDTNYRQLAEEMSAAFKESEKRRQDDAAALAEVKQRLGAIETLLRQVE
jgi:hypothetical protein